MRPGSDSQPLPVVRVAATDGASRGLLPSGVLVQFGVCLVVLAALFQAPLRDWVAFALKYDLHSHVLLIPFISIYLVWIERHRPQPAIRRSLQEAGIVALFGVGVLLTYGSASGWRWNLGRNDHLSVIGFAFLCLMVAGLLVVFGWPMVRRHAFAVGFLLFAVPLPSVVVHGLSVFLQHASAEASYVLLQLFGTPVFRQGLVFVMPGMTIEVAEECSGIRSTLVLFITSLLAGRMFLKSGWRWAVLAGIVFPLGIFRNALRIVTISLLCVHLDPSYIDAPIHRRGGPLFFAVSMIPFFAVLWWLRRGERQKAAVDEGKLGGQ